MTLWSTLWRVFGLWQKKNTVLQVIQRVHSLPQWILRLFVCLLLTLVVTHAYWGNRFPYTHDGENHLARFANYAAALKERQWPPRFAPYVYQQYGFPVFHYNYPLANILAAPLVMVSLNPERVYAIVQLVLLMVGGWALWEWFVLRRWSAGWWAVGQYYTSAVLLNTIFFRGNIGEIATYALLPMLFYGMEKYLAEKRWGWWSVLLTLLLSAWLLAHNIFAVFLSPLLLLYQIVRRGRFRWRDLLPWVWAAALVAWFWIPAVLELPLVVLQQDALANEAAAHLLTFPEVWGLSSLSFGFSRPSPLDSLTLGMGWLFTMQFVLMLSYLFSIRFHRLTVRSTWQRREMWLLAIFSLIALCLSWEGTRWFWQHVPLLKLMQFPWRWLIVPSIFLLPWQAFIFVRSPRVVKFALGVLLLFSVRNVWQLQPADFFHKEPASYLSFPGSTLTRNENRPVTLTDQPLPAWELGPRVVEGAATVESIGLWRGSRRSYVIHVDQDALIVEPTVYFPGWKTKSGGEELEQVFTDATQGLIAYRLPARVEPYTITTIFGALSIWRAIGEGGSLLALGGGVVAVSTLFSKRRSV